MSEPSDWAQTTALSICAEFNSGHTPGEYGCSCICIVTALEEAAQRERGANHQIAWALVSDVAARGSGIVLTAVRELVMLITDRIASRGPMIAPEEQK